MKHSEVINAYIVLERLSSGEMPLSVSYKLFKTKKLLQPQWDFQKERIDTIMNRYAPQKLMDGSVKFRNKKEGEKCASELNEMINEIGNMDVEFADLKKPTISLNTDINLSIDDIDALSPFIDFIE